MTLSQDAAAFIDARFAESETARQTAEAQASTNYDRLVRAQAERDTALAQRDEALARVRELEEDAAKGTRVPVDVTNAAGWTIQDRSTGTQSNDASVNLRENTLFTPEGLKIKGTDLPNPINSRSFGSGDVLGRHIAVPNHFRAEVDAILPTAPGSWPCPLWFRPLGGPNLNDGEIDVVETWPHDWGTTPKAWAAIHPEYTSSVGAKKANAGLAYSRLPIPDPTVKHTYTVEKTYRRIAFWVDDIIVYEWNDKTFNDNVRAWWDRIMEIPDRTWYPRVTLQVGGAQTGGYPKRPWAGCEMLVTDIRIWAK